MWSLTCCSLYRVDVAADLQSSRGTALCYLGAGGGLVPGLQSYLLAGGGRSSPGGSSLPTDSPTSHPPTEEELEEDYYGSTVHPGLYQHIYGHAGNPYSKFSPGWLLVLRLIIIIIISYYIGW